MNKFDFKYKVAIVTGGAQGFGLDIAKKFLDYGAKVRLWDIDEKELKKVILGKLNNIEISFLKNLKYFPFWKSHIYSNKTDVSNHLQPAQFYFLR